MKTHLSNKSYEPMSWTEALAMLAVGVAAEVVGLFTVLAML